MGGKRKVSKGKNCLLVNAFLFSAETVLPRIRRFVSSLWKNNVISD